MNGDKIDFSALDPSRDAERWEACIQRVSEAALARRRPTPALSDQLLAWLRPAMVLAAFLALLVWGVALIGPGAVEPGRRGSSVWTEARSTAPALLVARWAAEDARPAPIEVLSAFGGHHDKF